jgi:hypothetical protein
MKFVAMRSEKVVENDGKMPMKGRVIVVGAWEKCGDVFV